MGGVKELGAACPGTGRRSIRWGEARESPSPRGGEGLHGLVAEIIPSRGMERPRGSAHPEDFPPGGRRWRERRHSQRPLAGEEAGHVSVGQEPRPCFIAAHPGRVPGSGERHPATRVAAARQAAGPASLQKLPGDASRACARPPGQRAGVGPHERAHAPPSLHLAKRRIEAVAALRMGADPGPGRIGLLKACGEAVRMEGGRRVQVGSRGEGMHPSAWSAATASPRSAPPSPVPGRRWL